MMYYMTDTAKKSKLFTFRCEEENIASIDRLARSQGISRSAWFRRAVLAQLVQDLVAERKEREAIDTLQVVAENMAEPEVPYSTVHDEELGDHPPLDGPVAHEHEWVDGTCWFCGEPLVPQAIADVSRGIELRTHHIDCIKSYDHEGECL